MRQKFIIAASCLFVLSLALTVNAVLRDNNSDGKVVTSLQSSLRSFQFDENNIAIKFAAISDIHIKGFNEEPSQKFAAALEQLYFRAGGELDAIFVTGDLTEYGLPEQVTELKRIIDESKVDLNKTKFIFAIGNHDYYNHLNKGVEWTGGYLFKDVFGDKIYFGATNDEIIAGNHHAVVNGYDFIVVNCAKYFGGIDYAESDIIWLKRELKKAAERHPNKTIFVGSHPQIEGTNFGSNGGKFWSSKDLYDVLKDFPQVIYFGGHIHFPENDERSIWQGEFTTVEIASTYYLANYSKDDDNGNRFIDIDKSGFKTFDAHSTPSQGMYIEVDINSNVKITRIDFTYKKIIKDPWIIPSPKEDSSHLLCFTPQREAKIFGKTPPVFPDSGEIKELSKMNGEYKIQLTQATDNDMVYCYQISFVDNAANKIIKTISTLSDFYMYSNPSEMVPLLVKTISKADSVLAPFSLNYPNDYFIKVVAVDCFGLKSLPLVSDVIYTSDEN